MVKYGQLLKENKVHCWESFYIQFDFLKKLISPFEREVKNSKLIRRVSEVSITSEDNSTSFIYEAPTEELIVKFENELCCQIVIALKFIKRKNKDLSKRLKCFLV